MIDENDDPGIRTRVSETLGVRYPIVQAPMGWIARAPLASAVSNAGGMPVFVLTSMMKSGKDCTPLSVSGSRLLTPPVIPSCLNLAV